MNQQQTNSLHIVVWCGIMPICILSEFQPRGGSDIAVKNCCNLALRRMVQELLTSNDKIAQFHHQGDCLLYYHHQSVCFDVFALCPIQVIKLCDAIHITTSPWFEFLQEANESAVD